MAEFTEVLRQFNRMCSNAVACRHGSKNCPLVNVPGSCAKWVRYHAEEAERIIMNWAKEHPAKTNADKFKEVFGHDIHESPRRCDIFRCNGQGCSVCEYKGFWDREYKEREDK